MKKTNTFKRFAAITSASILAACMVAPMAMTSNAASIEITGISTEVPHTFEVYQVFTGELSTDATNKEVLSNLKWGSDVTAYNDGTNAVASITVDSDVPEAVYNAVKAGNARTIVDWFTLGTTTKTMTSSSGTASLTGLADGYYIVKDVTALGEEDDSNSAWIVEVAGTASVAIKNAKPTVDKQVWDNEDNAWGETADWNINDKYMSDDETPAQQAGFRLEATITADTDLAFYDSYKLVFHDKMSDGVTYDGIRSVKVKVEGKDDVVITDGYTLSSNAVSGAAGIDWTLTIADLKQYLPEGVTLGSADIIVEVIYNAHLNEDAIVHDKTTAPNGETYSDDEGTNVNNNNVYLEYSNNPDGTGTGTGTGGEGDDTGKTTDDTVGVFTYTVNNTKYKESTTGGILPGAEFKLYSDSACTQEIYLKAVGTDVKYYIPADIGATSGEAMISQSDGTFKIAGLDAGTYYVKETVAPTGYNLIKDATAITITASHSEKDATTAVLDLGESKMSYDYVNKKGSSLPETGGIGTTLFYLGGGAMVAVAGVYLISKKRMKNAE